MDYSGNNIDLGRSARQLTSILEASLTKLSRYDEGTFLAPILSMTVRRHDDREMRFEQQIISFQSIHHSNHASFTKSLWQSVLQM